MSYAVETTALYDEWLKAQTPKMQAQIAKRLANIKAHGHFGHTRQLDSRLAEIKFNNGIRIYFAMKSATTLILLLGGNKNGQDKDIKKAKALLA